MYSFQRGYPCGLWQLLHALVARATRETEKDSQPLTQRAPDKPTRGKHRRSAPHNALAAKGLRATQRAREEGARQAGARKPKAAILKPPHPTRPRHARRGRPIRAADL